MSEHAPGSLTLRNDGLIVGKHLGGKRGRWVVAEMSGSLGNPAIRAAAHRLVACWNACEGINPEAVPDLLEVAETATEVLAATFEEADRNEDVRELRDFFRATIAKAKSHD